MMFLHMRDIDIHTFEIGLEKVPNKTWAATNEFMQAYATEKYNSFFSVYIISLILDLKVFQQKAEFLRDDRHPNAARYSMMTDMLFNGILNTWSRALEANTYASLLAHHAIADSPLVTRSRYPNLANVHPEVQRNCLMSMPPQFSEVRVI